MKANLFFVAAVIICATGSMMSMEGNKGKARLNFRLDMGIKIQAYSNQNMAFSVKPEEFLGKSIPCDQKDHTAMMFGFCEALEGADAVKVPYTLEQKNFMATIRALKTKDSGIYEYFVKITADK